MTPEPIDYERARVAKLEAEIHRLKLEIQALKKSRTKPA
jgi:uncharacterized small protein (DUF1192 family)